MDVASFLRRFPPFDGLDPDRLQRAADATREERYAAGAVIIQRSGAPSAYLYVVVEGSVEVVAEGRVLDIMGEGEVFGEMSLLTGQEPVATVRARQDTLCYVLERGVAQDTLGTRPGAAFLTASLRRRFDHLAAANESQPVRPVGMTVGSLVQGRPVVCDPSTSVAAVARAMAEARTSAAIVPVHDRPGIVTDVDLRTKVLAAGRDPSMPVSEVVSSPAHVIAEDALADEALFQMVQGGFHHLPVISASGEVVGVVTETDVIGFGPDSPFALRSAIERAADVGEAVDAARRMPESVAALVESGVDAVHIGHVVGATIDALTRRALDFAFDEHGTPPVAWAWLALGSLGRREQALHTDQDHGLAYEGAEDDEERLDPYFVKVATFVTQALENAGLPRCRGNMMAVSAGLRRSRAGWVDAVERWIRKHEMHAAEVAAIVFDFRRVAGPLDIESALDRVIRQSRTEPGFLKRLAKHAQQSKPPTGFMRDFIVEGSGQHAGTLDLKHGGIMLITDVARLHVVVAGMSAHRTLDRLRLASEAGRINEQTREGLEEAFRLLWQLRLDHQVACIRAGRSPDDFVDPKSLSPVRRQGLREAFRIIARAQRGLNLDFA